MTTSPAPCDNGTYAVEGRDDLASARLQLLAATRFQLAIHVPTLSPEAFSSAEELTELRRIATSGRGAEIRILLHDPGTIQRQGSSAAGSGATAVQRGANPYAVGRAGTARPDRVAIQ